MNYVFTPVEDKRIRRQMLFMAHDLIHDRRLIPRDQVEDYLRRWVVLAMFRYHPNAAWNADSNAERGVREAPENQEWINAWVRTAMEDADAVQAQQQQLQG